MQPLPLSLALLLCLPVASLAADFCRELRFEAELTAGLALSRPIGAGLELRVKPGTEFQGWTFEFASVGADGTTTSGLIYPVTIPWRSRHPTMLDTSYGFTAQAVLDSSPRAFWFLLDASTGRRAWEALADVLWANPSRSEDSARSFLRALPKGVGKVRVLGGSIREGDETKQVPADKRDYGALHSLRVEFMLVVPSSFRHADNLRVAPAPCPNTATWPNLP